MESIGLFVGQLVRLPTFAIASVASGISGGERKTKSGRKETNYPAAFFGLKPAAFAGFQGGAREKKRQY